MTESVREFSKEISQEIGELTRERNRFLELMLDFTGNLRQQLSGKDALLAHNAIAQELDNVRAALDLALNTRGLESQALKITADIGAYWTGAGLINEGVRWTTKAIESNRYPDPHDLAWCTLYLLRMKYMSGDRSASNNEALDKIIEVMEAQQEMRGLCIALSTRGWRYLSNKETLEKGKVLMQRAVGVAR